MDKIIKIIGVLAAVVAVLCAVFFVTTSQTSSPAQTDISSATRDTIYFFYGEECPHCHTVMPFIENMSRKYPEANIQMLEVWHNQTNQGIYASVHEKLNREATGVPEVVIGNVILVGSRDIPDQLELLIQERLKK